MRLGLPLAAFAVSVLAAFGAEPQPGTAKVTQHLLLFEPAGDRLAVSESILIENTGKATVNAPAGGAVKVYVPDAGVSEARVAVTSTGAAPAERTLSKTKQPGVYAVESPIPPGETRFDVSYAIPFSDRGTFSGRSLTADAPLRLLAPSGVTISGKGLELLGREPSTQASVFGVKDRNFTVEVQGKGTLSTPASGGEEENAGPGIEEIAPRVYDRGEWVVGLGLANLLVGFILLYQRGDGAGIAPALAAAKQKELRRR